MRALVLVAILLLAGCANAPPPVDPCAGDACAVVIETQAVPADAPPPEERIQGIIIDNTYAPIIGATVRLMADGTSLGEATTGPDGKFVFLQILDRVYELETTHDKFLDTRTLLLPTGIPTHILVPMERRIEQPRHTLVEWSGFMRCGAYTGTTLSDIACYPVRVAMGEGFQDSRFFFEELLVPGPPATLGQVELVWRAGMDSAETLRLDVLAREPESSRNSGRIGWISGNSPLVLPIAADDVAEHGLGDTGPDGKGLLLDVQASGTPVGLAMDQRFDAYVSLVYGDAPAEGWTYVHDGTP